MLNHFHTFCSSFYLFPFLFIFLSVCLSVHPSICFPSFSSFYLYAFMFCVLSVFIILYIALYVTYLFIVLSVAFLFIALYVTYLFIVLSVAFIFIALYVTYLVIVLSVCRSVHRSIFCVSVLLMFLLFEKKMFNLFYFSKSNIRFSSLDMFPTSKKDVSSIFSLHKKYWLSKVLLFICSGLSELCKMNVFFQNFLSPFLSSPLLSFLFLFSFSSLPPLPHPFSPRLIQFQWEEGRISNDKANITSD